MRISSAMAGRRQRLARTREAYHQYRFRLVADAPPRRGRYTVELGLVSDQVTSFERAGTPPLRLDVEVRDR